MTTGDYPPPYQPPDPNLPPPPGGYPPPPPGGYPPPPPGYGPPSGYPIPQYGQPGGYPPPTPQYGQPGGLGTRFLARVIDGIIVGIIAFILALIFGSQDNVLVTGLFSGLLMFIYFVGTEVSQGASLGKKILGLSVLGAGGAPKPDLRQSAIRNSFTLLSVIPYIGGLLALIAYAVIAVTINGSPTKQGKHDELAGGTQVVKH